MRERKTFSLLLMAAPYLPGMLVSLSRDFFPSFYGVLPLLGFLFSLFGFAYLLASERSWHAVLCGLASGFGLLYNFSLLLVPDLDPDWP